MSSALLRCMLLVVSLLLVGVPAAAQPSAEAKRLYAEGKAAYAQGHYVDAIAAFERSYALSQSSALLFNMAQAHRLAGPAHCVDAVVLYKSYLAAFPEAENQREVAERIAELGDCPPVAPPPPSRAEPEPARSSVVAEPAAVASRGLPTGPVIVTGAGAALLVAGGVLYARAWDKHREAERICPCYPGSYSDWELLTNVSYALLAVGGATLAGGVSWWVVAEPRVSYVPARAMLGVSGAF